MKLYLKNIASIFLASIVFLSTMSFSMNIHHCMNNMMEESCTMETELSPTNCNLVSNNKCCSTDIIIKVADNELKKTTINNYSDTVIFLYAYINLFEGLEENIIPFLNYDSPLISKDLQVINETFLI
ncbi:MAG: hypothetical protein L3J34_01215 [Flavobacteriaceae bacterium]|nr:hypothetical protein [Flavobacteriaceae bacterium]